MVCVCVCVCLCVLVDGILWSLVDLMSQSVVVLKKILEQESKGWYIKYKDRLITELKGLTLSGHIPSDFDHCYVTLYD